MQSASTSFGQKRTPGFRLLQTFGDILRFSFSTSQDRECGTPSSFSPDGSEMGHLAREGNRRFAVVGSKKGPDFDEVQNLMFS